MKPVSLIMTAVVLGLAMNVAAADGKAAAGKAQALCAGCHGPNGISVNPLWPNLAGQQSAYLAKSIRDYKSGQREDPVMSAVASALTEAEINDLAAYFASLPPGG